MEREEGTRDNIYMGKGRDVNIFAREKLKDDRENGIK